MAGKVLISMVSLCLILPQLEVNVAPQRDAVVCAARDSCIVCE